MFYLKISNDWYYSDLVPSGCWRISEYAFTDRTMQCIRINGEMLSPQDHGIKIYDVLTESTVTLAILTALPIQVYMTRCGENI